MSRFIISPCDVAHQQATIHYTYASSFLLSLCLNWNFWFSYFCCLCLNHISYTMFLSFFICVFCIICVLITWHYVSYVFVVDVCHVWILKFHAVSVFKFSVFRPISGLVPVSLLSAAWTEEKILDPPAALVWCFCCRSNTRKVNYIK